jgi:hypothetical protein
MMKTDCYKSRRESVPLSRLFICGVTTEQHTDCFGESSDLLAQLPPGQEHGPDNRRDIGTVEQQSFNLPIEGAIPASRRAEGRMS